jgi:hypothetical protein
LSAQIQRYHQVTPYRFYSYQISISSFLFVLFWGKPRSEPANKEEKRKKERKKEKKRGRRAGYRGGLKSSDRPRRSGALQYVWLTGVLAVGWGQQNYQQQKIG